MSLGVSGAYTMEEIAEAVGRFVRPFGMAERDLIADQPAGSAIVSCCVNGRGALNNVGSMLITFADRPSDSPFIERVWRSHSDQAGVFHSIAACHWVMVVTRLEGKMSLTVRGPETKATMADCPAQGEWFGVHFKLGTFMPLMRSGDLRDRNDVTLPNATSRSFWLNGSAWDFPILRTRRRL